MSSKPRLIITVEGLASDAISAYGSSWNQTPALDQWASRSVTHHRTIIEEDHPLHVPRKIIDAAKASGLNVTLVTDQPDLVATAEIDEVVTLELAKQASVVAIDQVEETHLALLFAAFQEAIDRRSDLPNQVIWLHTQSLHRVWDAPRELVPQDELNLEREHAASLEEPVEYVEDFESFVGNGDDEDSSDEFPWVLDIVEAPRAIAIVDAVETFDAGECPREAMGAWMRTYGCQVRLLDLVLGIVLSDVKENPMLLMGTTGYALGQADVIGHRAGPVITSQVQVPCLVSMDGQPRRELDVQSAAAVISSFFSESEGEKMERVIIESERTQRTVITQEWAVFWDAPDREARLFLQPQDQHNVNDVARLRWDIVDDLSQ